MSQASNDQPTIQQRPQTTSQRLSSWAQDLTLISNLSNNQIFRFENQLSLLNSRRSRSIHPSFQTKAVCHLDCRFCKQKICKRGMKAILLADTRVELFSTDSIPIDRVQLVFDDYTTRNCKCNIRDVACLGCGNVIGYHVTKPCEACMNACNNGHFWMFHSDGVKADEVSDSSGKVINWGSIEKIQETCEAILVR